MAGRGTNGRLYHPNRPVPWDADKGILNDKEFAIDHFFRKLLLLKSGMHTDVAIQEAEIRHQWMIDFLVELERELECSG